MPAKLRRALVQRIEIDDLQAVLLPEREYQRTDLAADRLVPDVKDDLAGLLFLLLSAASHGASSLMRGAAACIIPIVCIIISFLRIGKTEYCFSC